MVNGLYTSAAGMMHLQRKQEINSNNLANANSTGFKQARLITKVEIQIRPNDELKLHQDEAQTMDEVKTLFTRGPLVQTDNKMDLAIAGEGFFAIETDEGVRYTRKGSFTLNVLGELSTLNGHRVLDDKGGRVLMENDKFTLASDGGLFRKGEKVGRLGVFRFDDNEQLLPRGMGLYENMDSVRNPAEQVALPSVKQGYLEGANVNTVDSMVQMIVHLRNYEASQKSLHAIDDTLKKAVNEVGRVG